MNEQRCQVERLGAQAQKAADVGGDLAWLLPAV